MADTTIYIDFDSATGSDTTGDGSSGSPYQTPWHASSNVPSLDSGDTLTYLIRNGDLLLENEGKANTDQRFQFDDAEQDGVHIVIEADTGEPTPLLGNVFAVRIRHRNGIPASLTVTADTRNDANGLDAGDHAIDARDSPGAEFGYDIAWTGNVRLEAEGRANKFINSNASNNFTGDITILGQHEYVASWVGFESWSGTVTLSDGNTNDFGSSANYGGGGLRPLFQKTSSTVQRVGNVIDYTDYTGDAEAGAYSGDGVEVGSGDVLWDFRGDWNCTSGASLIDITGDIDSGSGTFQVRFKDNSVVWDSTTHVIRYGDVEFTDTANDMPRTAAFNAGTGRMKAPIFDGCTISNPGTGDGIGEVLDIGPNTAVPVDGEGMINATISGAGAGHAVNLIQLMRFEGNCSMTTLGGIAALFYGGVYIKAGAKVTLCGHTTMYPARSGGSNWESVQRWENHGTLVLHSMLTKAEFDATDAATDLFRAAFTDRGGMGNATETFQDYMDGGEIQSDRPDPYGPQWKHYGENAAEAGPTYTDLGPLGLKWVKFGKVQVIKQHPDIPAFRFGRPSGAASHEYIETSDVNVLRDFLQGTGDYTAQGAWATVDSEAGNQVTVGVGGTPIWRNPGIGLGIGL